MKEKDIFGAQESHELAQSKSISVEDQNASEQMIKDRLMGITAKNDYQNPNP